MQIGFSCDTSKIALFTVNRTRQITSEIRSLWNFRDILQRLICLRYTPTADSLRLTTPNHCDPKALLDNIHIAIHRLYQSVRSPTNS